MREGTVATGIDILDLARKHVGEKYILGARAFQIANGLVADGLVGPQTLGELNLQL